MAPSGTDARGRARLAARVIGSYDDFVSRVYCHIRFRIINRRFLSELHQYLPTRGRVLELGCGFGLFSLYFALANPGLAITGIDLSERRIRMARQAAGKLGVANAQFRAGDARQFEPDGDFDAIYMLDLIHHVPPALVPEILAKLNRHLRPGGILLIKDVDTRPFLKMAFTWLLDLLVTRGEWPHYWPSDRLIATLRGAGFQVFCHSMPDLLPYPHRLYFCVKDELTHLNGA